MLTHTNRRTSLIAAIDLLTPFFAAKGFAVHLESAKPELEQKITLNALLYQLGTYPNGYLKVSIRKEARRDTPRAKCSKCGYQVPMLKTFLAYGPPICPKDKVEMEALGDWEDI